MYPILTETIRIQVQGQQDIGMPHGLILRSYLSPAFFFLSFWVETSIHAAFFLVVGNITQFLEKEEFSDSWSSFQNKNLNLKYRKNKYSMM